MRRLFTWFGGLGRREKALCLAMVLVTIAMFPCYALGIATVTLKKDPVQATPTRQVYVPAATRPAQTATATPAATATKTTVPTAAPPTQTLEPTPTQFVPPTSVPTPISPSPSAAPTQLSAGTPLPGATATRPAPTATLTPPAVLPTATNRP